MGQSAHVAERVSIPSSAVAVDGPANDHRSILVINSPDNKPEDNAGAIENDLAPEQSARTSGRVFVNSIVSAASLAAAAKIAAPSLAEAETPANLIAVAVSVEPDPIYAAIEQFEEARANDDAALHAHGNAVKAFRGRHGSNFPNALTAEVAEAFRAAGYKGNASFFLRTHDEITAHKNGSFAEHIPFFHRTLNIQTNDYEKNVTPFEEAYEKADDNQVDAMKAVFETAPTTLAGLRAKIDFVMSVPDVTECLTCATTDEPLRNFPRDAIRVRASNCGAVMSRHIRLVEPSSITLDMEEDLRCALNLARALRYMGAGMPRDQAEPVVEMADIMIDRLNATTNRWRKLNEVLAKHSA